MKMKFTYNIAIKSQFEFMENTIELWIILKKKKKKVNNCIYVNEKQKQNCV